MKRLFLAVAFVFLCTAASAQRFALSTNALDYANFGTLNADLSFALSQHWSVGAGAKYNPFSYKNAEGESLQNRQRSVAVGARWWPWHIWSGWWMAGKLQYREYNSGGILSQRTEEGDSYGGGLSFGYSYMLGTHINVEAGVGAWTGVRYYTVYACPTCGMTEDKGKKFFVLPNDLLLSVSYVF